MADAFSMPPKRVADWTLAIFSNGNGPMVREKKSTISSARANLRAAFSTSGAKTQ